MQCYTSSSDRAESGRGLCCLPVLRHGFGRPVQRPLHAERFLLVQPTVSAQGELNCAAYSSFAWSSSSTSSASTSSTSSSHHSNGCLQWQEPSRRTAWCLERKRWPDIQLEHASTCSKWCKHVSCSGSCLVRHWLGVADLGSRLTRCIYENDCLEQGRISGC